MGTVPVESFRDNGEHRSVTLGDLAALIAGIAVVLVLPTRQSYWPLPSDFLGSLPRWLPWFFCLRAGPRGGVRGTCTGRLFPTGALW